jgi:hypothetical protein
VSAVQVEKGLLEPLEVGHLFSVLPDEGHVRSLQLVEVIYIAHLVLPAGADFVRLTGRAAPSQQAGALLKSEATTGSTVAGGAVLLATRASLESEAQ